MQVCDFGLAHMIGAARRTAAAMGTIAYAAPELLEGKPGPGTDQYCLAITYFELRTGALPYDQESAVAVMEAVRKGELNLSKIPEPEQRVIRKATSVSMADRYASAMEMVSELRTAATGVEGKAAPRAREFPARGESWPRHRRWCFWVWPATGSGFQSPRRARRYEPRGARGACTIASTERRLSHRRRGLHLRTGPGGRQPGGAGRPRAHVFRAARLCQSGGRPPPRARARCVGIRKRPNC